MSDWHNVSKSEPCPICHKTDWCNLSNDGAVCICHRVESPYPARSGSGWIHRLRAQTLEKTDRVVPRIRGGGMRRRNACVSEGHPEAKPSREAVARGRDTSVFSKSACAEGTCVLNFSRIHASYDADPVLLEGLATTLGVDDQPLKAMDVRFNHFDQCWSFPMRDADGKIVGLRFREHGGSKKWSARGSHDGLFYAPSINSDSSDATLTLREGSGVQPQLQTHDGSNGCGCGVRSCETVVRAPAIGVNSPNELIIVEGPSDTAALLSLFNQQLTTINQQPTIVGRSSCQSGAPTLRQYIRRVRPRYITIVADNDTPGIRGADLLATQLTTNHVPVRVLVVPHPYKDIRAWYLSGKLSIKLFCDVSSAQAWRQ